MMADKLLDSAYKKDHDDFVQKLQEFHDARGTSIGKIPSFGGQPLDLYALYNTVTNFGGISVVTDRKKWGQIFTTLGYPPCTNAEYALRQHYARYLESFERIYFFGEDADDLNDNVQFRSHVQMIKYKRLNKPPKIGSLGEPLLDNFNRIAYSLQSGLQNEVNFALNICSLLSNVSNSIFNLAKSPKILDLMLSHCGIWSKDKSYTKLLYDDWYSDSDQSFEKFWLTSLDEPVAFRIYKSNYIDNNCPDAVKSYETNELFAKRKLDAPESVRVNQICTILYNFSSETINAVHLATHDAAIRFLLFSSCCLYSNIRKTGLDALDNISDCISLIGVEDPFTQDLFHILHNFFNSHDKFRRVRAMTILSKLASQQDNNKILTKLLTADTYEILLQTLHLPDISLLLSSLDALYYLSGLNEIAATNIAMVHGSIENLVCLVTIRAESFGNRAIQGFRIVENKHSIFTPKNQNWLRQQEERRRQLLHHPMAMAAMNSMPRSYPRTQQNLHMPRPLGPDSRLPPTSGPNISYPPMNSLMNQTQGSEQLVELDPEIYAAHWMSGFYEPHHTDKLSVQLIYEDFVKSCKDCKRNNILSVEGFTEVLRAILPPHLAKITEGEDGHLYIIGIQRRQLPTQVHSKVPRSVHDQLLRNKIMAKQQKQTPVPTINLADTKDFSLSLTTKRNEFNDDKENRVNITLPSHHQEQKLETTIDCQDFIDKLKPEIQGHFKQFHTHRQQIQVVQLQIQQLMSQQAKLENVPADVVNDVQSRVQNHHQQMANHYQKLQELNVLSEQVQKKMQQLKDLSEMNSLPNPLQSAMTALQHQSPMGSPLLQQKLQPGSSFTVPPSVPYISHDTASVQHNIPHSPGFPSTPTRPLRGRGSRGGKMRTASPRGRGSRGGRGSRSRARGLRGLRGKRGSRGSPRFPRVGVAPQPIVNGYGGMSPFNTTAGNTPYPLQNSMSPMGMMSPSHNPQSFTSMMSSNIRSPLINTPQTPMMSHAQSPMMSHTQSPMLSHTQSPTMNQYQSPMMNQSQSPMMNHAQSPMMNHTQSPTMNQYQSPMLNLSQSPMINHAQLPMIHQSQPPTINQRQSPMINLSQSPMRNQPPQMISQSQSLMRNQPQSPMMNQCQSPMINQPLGIVRNQNINSPSNTNYNEFQYPAPPSYQQSSIVSNPSSSELLQRLQQSPSIRKPSLPINKTVNIDSPSNLPINTSEPVVQEQNFKQSLGGIDFSKHVVDQPDQVEHKLLPEIPGKRTFSHDETNGNDELISLTKKIKIVREEKDIGLTNGNTLMNGISLKNSNIVQIDNCKDLIVARIENAPKTNGVAELNHILEKSNKNTLENDIVASPKDRLFQNHFSEYSKNMQSNSVSEFRKENYPKNHISVSPEELPMKNGLPANNIDYSKVNGINGFHCNGNDIGEVEKTNNTVLKDETAVKCGIPDRDEKPTELSSNKNLSEKHLDEKTNFVQDESISHQVMEDEVTKETCNEEDIPYCVATVVQSIVNHVLQHIEQEDTKQLPTKVNRLRLELVASNHDVLDTGKTEVLQYGKDEQVELATSYSEFGEQFFNLTKPPPMSQICYCQWKECAVAPFKRPLDLLAHMIQTHAPLHGQILRCGVIGCKTGRKPRGDMITHFQEEHCLLKKEDGNYTTVPLPDPRLLLGSLDTHEDESPVTRSVRYTAALILRNIARLSSEGRRLICIHESKLAVVAMSTSEAACAVSDCLLALNNEKEKISDTEEEDNEEEISDVDDEEEDYTSELGDDISIVSGSVL